MRRGESPMSIDTRLLKIGAQIKLKRSWKLNQPIPLAEVEAIESKYGFQLPEEYVTSITEIANGCENFPAANSCGKGGVFFSLAQLDRLPNLGKPFYFTEDTEEVRNSLMDYFGPNAYTGKHPIWSSLFRDLPRENPLSPV